MNRTEKFLKFCADTFGPLALERHERAARFLEEALELAQASGVSVQTCRLMITRTYARPSGTIDKEMAQCQLTLDIFACNEGCSSKGLRYLANAEIDRCYAVPREEWHRRHKAKSDLGIAIAKPIT